MFTHTHALQYEAKPDGPDPDFARKVTEIEVELKALEMTVMRVIATESKRKDKKPDPATSVLKIKGTEIQQAITELLMQVGGPLAQSFKPIDYDGFDQFMGSLAARYFNYRKTSIYAGSNEIQRNIIAKMSLGL